MFAVFFGEIYYPGGGWSDHEGTFKDFKNAKKRLDDLKNQHHNLRYAWWQIVDLESGVILERDDNQDYPET